ncbi:MAG: hypothetical protein LIO96_03485 [Lachnospiraceae bacterium]|nr:hypothetical protein [Lachnospiraceae bacterium]
MITVALNESNFEYDIHSLVKAFYPDQEVMVRAFSCKENMAAADENGNATKMQGDATDGNGDVTEAYGDALTEREKNWLSADGGKKRSSGNLPGRQNSIWQWLMGRM